MSLLPIHAAAVYVPTDSFVKFPASLELVITSYVAALPPISFASRHEVYGMMIGCQIRAPLLSGCQQA